MEAVPHSLTESVEAILSQGAIWIQLAIEVVGVLLIAWGCLVTSGDFFRRSLAHQPLDFRQIRLRLGRYLAIGLEFQLAADIIATAFSPSWEHLGKLAVIAAIRTALNFFLNKEIEQEEAGGEPVPSDA